MNIKYLAPGGENGYYTWSNGTTTGVALLQIPEPQGPHDYLAHLVALHEMGHANADRVLGVTADVFLENVVHYEAQANAIALMWVKPECYAAAYEQCIAWLQTYVVAYGFKGSETRGILDTAIREVQTMWHKEQEQC